jgi:hypothetical protein
MQLHQMLRLRGGRARASEADQAPKSKKRDGPGGRTEGREEKSTKKLKKSTEGRENKSTKKKHKDGIRSSPKMGAEEEGTERKNMQAALSSTMTPQDSSAVHAELSHQTDENGQPQQGA